HRSRSTRHGRRSATNRTRATRFEFSFGLERHRAVDYRLNDLERMVDPLKFICLGRGTLANVDQIIRIGVMPGGTYVAILANGQELLVSHIQSRVLRGRLLRL